MLRCLHVFRFGRVGYICTLLGLLASGQPLMASDPVSPLSPVVSASNLYFDMGSFYPKDYLGFGWGRSEGAGSFNFRWINRLEADLWFEVDRISNMILAIRAAPLYLNYRRQKIGVYINNAYIMEWICPDDPGFRDYRVDVAATCFKKGKNRLTLRMSYLKRDAHDERELSLAVDTIFLYPRI